MKLYYTPGSCPLAPHIVLVELGLPHTIAKVDLKTKRHDGGDYLAVNGKGYVPTLELDDGQRLTEAAVILQYLADLKPEAQLAPPSGTMERYRMQELLNFLATEIHKGFGPLFKPDSSDGEKQRTRERLAVRFDWLANETAGRQFAFGSRFSIADAYQFTLLNWCQWTGIDLARWPALATHLARMADRPSVRQALQAEGLLKAAQAAA
jgi:glutathione S-transferase